LRDEVLLYIRGTLADADDSEAALPSPLCYSNQHLAGLVECATLGDILVDLFNEQRKRALNSLLSLEKRTGCLPDDSVSFVLVEIAGNIQHNWDVLLQSQFREFLGVFGSDTELALFIGTDVEDFVLLLEAPVFAVGVDDNRSVAAI